MAESLSMRERFVLDHARIAEAASEAIAVLSEPSPPDAARLSNARWAFASKLMQHLAIKERHLYAKLECDGRPQVARAFAASKDDLLKLFEHWTEFMEAWSTAKALSSWSSYRIKSIALVNSFVERLKHEENELFDLIDRFDIDISTPSPVTLNWTRKAFDVKAKVEDR